MHVPAGISWKCREGLILDAPRLEDGAALWRIARDSRTLDLNSSYSYLLWCRDFAATSVVAREAGRRSGRLHHRLRPPPAPADAGRLAGRRRRGGTRPRPRGGDARRAGGPRRRELGDRRDRDHRHPRQHPLEPPVHLLRRAPRRTRWRRRCSSTRACFPESGHEPEVLYRIGPVASLTDAGTGLRPDAATAVHALGPRARCPSAPIFEPPPLSRTSRNRTPHRTQLTPRSML